MTINLANNNPRIAYSLAQAATQQTFAIPFEFFNNSDITVYIDGVLKSEGTHYSLTGGDGSTGNVVFNTTVTGATGGSTIVIFRFSDIERTSDFSAGADINRAALNEQLDILTAMIADQNDKTDRTIRVSDYEIAPSLILPSIANRKGRVLAFNATTGAVEQGVTTVDIVNAEAFAASASASAASAAASYDSFDDRYLGAKTSNPTVDNDGNALITGALYFDSVNFLMKVYTGSGWSSLPTVGSTGNVGIGTATPAAQLEVSNDLEIIAIFTASITGVTMTVTSVSGGIIAVGDIVFGVGVSPITKITALGTGTGGVGTYTVSVNQTIPLTPLLQTCSSGRATIRLSDSGASTGLGLPAGTIEFFGGDVTSPGAGVGAYVSAFPESLSPDTALVFGTRDNLGVGVDANERMRITSNGAVGIGTSSPAKELHIQSSTPTIRLQSSVDTSYTNLTQGLGSFQIDVDPSNNGSNASFFSVDVNGQEHMRITDTGLVGIGTTTPAAQLEVSGSTSDVVTLTDSYINYTTLTVTTASSNTIAVGDIIYGAGVAPVTRILAQAGGTTGGAGTYSVSVNQVVPAGSGPMYAASSTAATIRISETDTSVAIGQPSGTIEFFGNDSSAPTFGIGAYVGAVSENTTPDTALVLGTRDNNGAGVDANERVRITSAGNVGIGLTAPLAVLHVNQSGTGSSTVFRASNTAGGALSVLCSDLAAEDPTWTIRTNANEPLAFAVSANEYMRITSAGNVGIGTTAPAAQLHVSGNTNLIAQFTASISDTTMTVASFTSGDGLIAVGDIVYGVGVSPITRITSFGNGTGSTGTYNVSVSQTVPSSSSIFTGSPTASKIRISDTDTTTSLGQPTGSIEFFSSDASPPTAGVGAYISAISEDSTPDTALTFGTRNADMVNGGVDANERMRITSDGNVGIGTSTPAENLDIQSATPIIRLSDTDGSFSRIAHNAATLLLQADEGGVGTGSMNFEVGGPERMRIDSAGRVGIGLTPSTVDPLTSVSAGALQINGNIELRYGGVATDPDGARYFNIVNTDTTLVTDQPLGGIQWIGLDTTTPNSNMASITSYCASNAGTTSDLRFKIAGSEKMRVSTAGNFFRNQPTETSKSAAVTLTIAELLTGIVQFTGSTIGTLTLPTGTNIEAGLPPSTTPSVSSLLADMSFDFSVINTGTSAGDVTLTTAAGLTLVGSMSVPITTSGLFRVRKTATNTYTIYRLS